MLFANHPVSDLQKGEVHKACAEREVMVYGGYKSKYSWALRVIPKGRVKKMYNMGKFQGKCVISKDNEYWSRTGNWSSDLYNALCSSSLGFLYNEIKRLKLKNAKVVYVSKIMLLDEEQRLFAKQKIRLDARRVKKVS